MAIPTVGDHLLYGSKTWRVNCVTHKPVCAGHGRKPEVILHVEDWDEYYARMGVKR
jgi:hypothetical protein